jgi:vancomycin resistance protein YoaR
MLRGLHTACLLAILVPFVAYGALLTGIDVLGPVRVRGLYVQRTQAGLDGLRGAAERWRQVQIALYAGSYVALYTRAELGATLPVERSIAKLWGLGRTGALGADLVSLWTSHSGGIDLALPPSIDGNTLADRLSALRRRVERPPVPGMVLADGSKLPGIPGITIDFAAAVDQVERALRDDAREVRLEARVVQPPAAVGYDLAAAGAFSVTLVAYETRYRTGGMQAGRAHNIELAVERLDGAVIPPGGELSFNKVVGERSFAKGFAGAKEIAARRIVDGVGGGVCQVAATLHAAAFLAGFALPEYRPHSRPAHYIDLGLDTMVSWPQQDMRIANVYPFPVRVRAHASDGALRISLEGAGKAHLVEWSTRILSRTKPGVQEILDSTLGAGEREELQDAIDGLTVRRVRTVYLPSGPRREEDTLRYPPNDRIVAVGTASGRRALSARARRTSLDYADF